MSLNIKDPEAHRIAQELARETGASMTEAVTIALRERLDRVRRGKRATVTSTQLLAIGRRCADSIKGPVEDHASLLYDERELPK